MKDPTAYHYETDRHEVDGWEGSGSLCDSCLVAWPCPKIVKWQASKTYRLMVLEDRVENLARENLRQNEELRDLREQGRRNDITIRGVLMPFIDDLTRGVTDGQATFSVYTDHQDFTSLGTSAITRVAGAREWRAKYESSSGLWEDGECTERRYRKT